jgi:hypothetical protein
MRNEVKAIKQRKKMQEPHFANREKVPEEENAQGQRWMPMKRLPRREDL